jgi:hypothetical protein
MGPEGGRAVEFPDRASVRPAEGWTARPAVVQRRVLRRRRVLRPPATLTADRAGAVVDPCAT